MEKVNLAISKQEKSNHNRYNGIYAKFLFTKKADFNNIHALSTIIESTENLTFRGVLEDILAGLEAGEYMYTTMEYYENIFPYIYINMIKVGELSGSLTQSLQQAVKYLDTSTDTSKNYKENNNSKCNTIGSINSIIICRKLIYNTYNTKCV